MGMSNIFSSHQHHFHTYILGNIHGGCDPRAEEYCTEMLKMMATVIDKSGFLASAVDLH